MAVAMFQPVTRGEISEMFGREISRDLIAALREEGLIAAGPRSPKLGAPTPMSRRRNSCSSSGSSRSATCRTSRRSRTRGCCGPAIRPVPQTGKLKGRTLVTACKNRRLRAIASGNRTLPRFGVKRSSRCDSATRFCPTKINDLNGLRRRSASGPRADQHVDTSFSRIMAIWSSVRRTESRCSDAALPQPGLVGN